MFMKKLFFAALLLFSLLLPAGAFADSIGSYVVPETVPLNQQVTATGVFSNGDVNGVLCSFYFLDAETQALVGRATDQYTDGTGRFALPGYVITEPRFVRGELITLKSACGTAEADANFLISQRQDVFPGIYPQGLALDLHFWTEGDNAFILWFVFIIFMFIVALGLGIAKQL